MLTPEGRKRLLWDLALRPKAEKKLQRAAHVTAMRAAELDPQFQHATTLRVPGRRIWFVLFDIRLRKDILAWQLPVNTSQKDAIVPSSTTQELWLGHDSQLYAARVCKQTTRKPKLLDSRTLDPESIAELPKWLGKHFARTLQH